VFQGEEWKENNARKGKQKRNAVASRPMGFNDPGAKYSGKYNW